MIEREGGCLCGAVRYRASGEPLITRICWCRDCQRISANGLVNALFPASAIDSSAAMSEYTSAADSGNAIRRRFCARCGCHVFASSSARPQYVVVRIGTLDDPSTIKPTLNMWIASAPAWACLDQALEQFERQPPPPKPSTMA